MKKSVKYFLAANSCEGFISHFNDCYNPNDNWKTYIIKGGPGTGKSSFMKKIAATAENKNENYILCPCSSDPNSLDAVILPKRKTVILDGTAPHTLDPRYPAVCEEILNFGQFWNTEKISNQKEIIELTDLNKALHKTASRYMTSAGQIALDTYKTVLSCSKIVPLKAFARKLCKKHIPAYNGNGYEWVRFISGITPQGIISFPETITATCKNLVIISDKYHTCSNIIINEVRNYCLLNGYEIITLKNPFLPSVLTDHIIIPALDLAFVTEDDFSTFDSTVRRIHARRFINHKLFRHNLPRIKLNNKVSKSLLKTAENTLVEAKATHDQLESYYINAMDFESLNKFTEDFCNQLLT